VSCKWFRAFAISSSFPPFSISALISLVSFTIVLAAYLMEALLNSAGMFELHNASAFSINSTILAFIGFKSPSNEG
jgi:hypothetical protein